MHRLRLRHVFVTGALALAILVVAAPARAFTGTAEGRVFDPNPVAALQDGSLTDQMDADYAAPQSAYRLVTLTNLEDSGRLRGDFADVCGNKSYAESGDGTFLFGRDHTWFEQVMGYYALTQAQLYIQSL